MTVGVQGNRPPKPVGALDVMRVAPGNTVRDPGFPLHSRACEERGRRLRKADIDCPFLCAGRKSRCAPCSFWRLGWWGQAATSISMHGLEFTPIGPTASVREAIDLGGPDVTLLRGWTRSLPALTCYACANTLGLESCSTPFAMWNRSGTATVQGCFHNSPSYTAASLLSTQVSRSFARRTGALQGSGEFERHPSKDHRFVRLAERVQT